MKIELKALTLNDGMDIYNMLQEIPTDENGYMNVVYGMNYEAYKNWLNKQENISKGIDLETWMVPQTCYWLYINDFPVGAGKLRHRLTELLKVEGGHIGYAIRPCERNKGYGTILCNLLVKEAKKLNIEKILLTIKSYNKPSISVAMKNKGVLEKIYKGRQYFWIDG